VCDTCKGYVKAEPTVSELPWWGVLLDDVATVPWTWRRWIAATIGPNDRDSAWK